MLVGVDPDAQSRGKGGRLVKAFLEEADRARVAAYLETSNERNLGYYERFGFERRGQLDVPPGLRMWTMFRGRE